MPPAASDNPNILFFVSDQHRYDWLERASELPIRTPNLTRLAERGVEFTNAVCPSPVCGPSRACLASGRDYDRAGALGGAKGWSLPPDGPNYHCALRDDSEYYVAGCGSVDLAGASQIYAENETMLDRLGFSDAVFNGGKNAAVKLYNEHGEARESYLEYLEERGLITDHVEDWHRRNESGLKRATFPSPIPAEAYADNWIARNGLSLLENAPKEQPWYLTVNFNGPHPPWDVTEEMHGWYRDPDVEFPTPIEPSGDPDPETHQEIRRNYAAMIENIDRWVGTYLDRLEERGERENTLVVFTSDHGELLGDYGRWGKFSPYHASVGIPMIVAGPGVESGRRCDEPVNLIDLQATFLDYAGVDPLPDADSRSLRPVLTGDTDEHRDYVYSGFGPWRMVYDGQFKLVTGLDLEGDHHADGLDFLGDDSRTRRDEAADNQTILFDVAAGERENLAESYPEKVHELRRYHDERITDI